jgi:hypothetical protein
MSDKLKLLGSRTPPSPCQPSSHAATPPPLDLNDSDIERWAGSVRDHDDEDDSPAILLHKFSPNSPSYKHRLSVSLSSVADTVARVACRVRRGNGGGGTVLMMNRKGGGRRRKHDPSQTVSFIDVADAILSLSDILPPSPVLLDRLASSLLALPLIGGHRYVTCFVSIPLSSSRYFVSVRRCCSTGCGSLPPTLYST